MVIFLLGRGSDCNMGFPTTSLSKTAGKVWVSRLAGTADRNSQNTFEVNSLELLPHIEHRLPINTDSCFCLRRFRHCDFVRTLPLKRVPLQSSFPAMICKRVSSCLLQVRLVTLRNYRWPANPGRIAFTEQHGRLETTVHICKYIHYITLNYIYIYINITLHTLHTLHTCITYITYITYITCITYITYIAYITDITYITHIHTHIHTYKHTYIHTHIRTYVHTYIHTLVHTYIS